MPTLLKLLTVVAWLKILFGICLIITSAFYPKLGFRYFNELNLSWRSFKFKAICREGGWLCVLFVGVFLIVGSMIKGYRTSLIFHTAPLMQAILDVRPILVKQVKLSEDTLRLFERFKTKTTTDQTISDETRAVISKSNEDNIRAETNTLEELKYLQELLAAPFAELK